MPGESLLLLGDSLIEFCDWQHRFPAAETRAFGRAGETVQGLAHRLAGDIGKLTPPDFVVLMSGTNNVALGDYLFFETYEQILLRLQEQFPSAALMVTGLFPFRLPWFDESVIPGLNRALANMSKRLEVRFLDMYYLATDGRRDLDGAHLGRYFQADNVHLSDRGYDLWTAAITEAMASTAGIQE